MKLGGLVGAGWSTWGDKVWASAETTLGAKQEDSMDLWSEREGDRCVTDV